MEVKVTIMLRNRNVNLPAICVRVLELVESSLAERACILMLSPGGDARPVEGVATAWDGCCLLAILLELLTAYGAVLFL